MALYTGHYSYAGADRLDITVKGEDLNGKHFAPTWSMVNRYKARIKRVKSPTHRKQIEDEYANAYYGLLVERHKQDPTPTNQLLVRAAAGDVTVVCFCPPNGFCHRYLLAAYLQHNFDVVYGGER